MQSRVKRAVMDLPHADLLLIDEAHNRGFDSILDAYRNRFPDTGVVGYTASPVGLKGVYKKLIIAGTKPRRPDSRCPSPLHGVLAERAGHAQRKDDKGWRVRTQRNG